MLIDGVVGHIEEAVSHQSLRGLHLACAVAALLVVGSAPASAQGKNKYTVCKDGTTWLSRANGICGRHGGVDPKRSGIANQTLNPYWPPDIEVARRREFERRLMSNIHISESNGAIAKSLDKNVSKTQKAETKAVKRAEKQVRKP